MTLTLFSLTSLQRNLGRSHRNQIRSHSETSFSCLLSVSFSLVKASQRSCSLNGAGGGGGCLCTVGTSQHHSRSFNKLLGFNLPSPAQSNLRMICHKQIIHTLKLFPYTCICNLSNLQVSKNTNIKQNIPHKHPTQISEELTFKFINCINLFHSLSSDCLAPNLGAKVLKRSFFNFIAKTTKLNSKHFNNLHCMARCFQHQSRVLMSDEQPNSRAKNGTIKTASVLALRFLITNCKVLHKNLTHISTVYRCR